MVLLTFHYLLIYNVYRLYAIVGKIILNQKYFDIFFYKKRNPHQSSIETPMRMRDLIRGSAYLADLTALKPILLIPES